MAVEVRRTAEGLELALSGQWGVREFGAIDAQLDGLELGGAHRVTIDAQPLQSLDLSGAWALHQFVARARATGAEVSFKGEAPDQLRLLDETLKEAEKGVEESAPAPPAPAPHGPPMRLLIDVGKRTEDEVGDFGAGLGFLGRPRPPCSRARRARGTCAPPPSPGTSTRPASPRYRSWR